MNHIEAAASGARSAHDAQDAKLRRACRELEAVFLRQLLQAMREGEQGDGLFETSAGEEMFTSLLDDQVASLAAQKMTRGIGDALYRQLSERLNADARPQAPDTERLP